MAVTKRGTGGKYPRHGGIDAEEAEGEGEALQHEMNDDDKDAANDDDKAK